MFQNNSTYFFCKPNIPRGLEAKKLQQNFIQFVLKKKLTILQNRLIIPLLKLPLNRI